MFTSELAFNILKYVIHLNIHKNKTESYFHFLIQINIDNNKCPLGV